MQSWRAPLAMLPMRRSTATHQKVPCSRNGAPGFQSLAQPHLKTTTLPATIVAPAVVTTAVWVATVVVTTAVSSPVNPAGVSMIIANLLQFRRGSSCADEVPIHWQCRGTEGAAQSNAKCGNCRENAYPRVRHFALPKSPSFLDIPRLDPCTISNNGSPLTQLRELSAPLGVDRLRAGAGHEQRQASAGDRKVL